MLKWKIYTHIVKEHFKQLKKDPTIKAQLKKIDKEIKDILSDPPNMKHSFKMHLNDREGSHDLNACLYYIERFNELLKDNKELPIEETYDEPLRRVFIIFRHNNVPLQKKLYPLLRKKLYEWPGWNDDDEDDDNIGSSGDSDE